MRLASVAVFCLFANLALASDVKDSAGMFGADAVSQAAKRLQTVEDATGVETVVDTFAEASRKEFGSDHDKNAFFQAWLTKEAEARPAKGIYILICKTPGRVQVGLHKRLIADGYSRERSLAIRDAALSELRNKNPDAALAAICTAVEAFAAIPKRAAAAAVALRPAQAKTAEPDWVQVLMVCLSLAAIVVLVVWLVRIATRPAVTTTYYDAGGRPAPPPAPPRYGYGPSYAPPSSTTVDGGYLIAEGGCDYTGWDCRAGNSLTVAESLHDAIKYGLNEEQQQRLGLSALAV